MKGERFVRLIVVLGPATAPDDLQRLINRSNIHIRYFTSSKFHSKLYIFGDKAALVGSANLTQSGMNSNREICVEISSGDDCFDDLVVLYNSYWRQAEPLTIDGLKKYAALYDASSKVKENALEDKIKKEFGDVVPTEGIEVGRKADKRCCFSF